MNIKQLLAAATLSVFAMNAMAAPNTNTNQPPKPQAEQIQKKQVKKAKVKKQHKKAQKAAQKSAVKSPKKEIR